MAKHRASIEAAEMSGKVDVKSLVAGCDNECAFGKWLYGTEIDAVTRDGVPCQVI